MNNAQIIQASPKRIATEVANSFLRKDIGEMGRDFDNLWENGRGEEIAEEFAKLYHFDADLREACLHSPNSRYFSTAMINAYPFVMPEKGG